MARLVVSQFISIDGVVEDPGGSEEFERGGWAFRFERGAEGDKFKLDEVMGADALLLGRTTYEGFAAAWPSRTGFADKFNGMPKYVVSSTLSDPGWSNSQVISGDVAAEVATLKERHDGDLLVNGSVQLVGTSRRARAGRRVPADGLPGDPGRRQAPLRRDQRPEAAEARELAAGRRDADRDLRAGAVPARSAPPRSAGVRALTALTPDAYGTPLTAASGPA